MRCIWQHTPNSIQKGWLVLDFGLFFSFFLIFDFRNYINLSIIHFVSLLWFVCCFFFNFLFWHNKTKAFKISRSFPEHMVLEAFNMIQSFQRPFILNATCLIRFDIRLLLTIRIISTIWNHWNDLALFPCTLHSCLYHYLVDIQPFQWVNLHILFSMLKCRLLTVDCRLSMHYISSQFLQHHWKCSRKIQATKLLFFFFWLNIYSWLNWRTEEKRIKK